MIKLVMAKKPTEKPAPSVLGLGERIALCEEALAFLEFALVRPPKAHNFSDFYAKILAFQFCSHLRAVICLLRNGFDSEVWILCRSMTELCIRIKWIDKKPANAIWIIIGEQYAERNKLQNEKVKTKMNAFLIDTIDKRTADLTPQVGHFKTEDLRFVSLFGFFAAQVR